MQVPVTPVDVTSVVAVFMGTLIVIIPIAGVAARFALKPIAEAVVKISASQSANEQLPC
jgi:hypothetical protein